MTRLSIIRVFVCAAVAVTGAACGDDGTTNMNPQQPDTTGRKVGDTLPNFEFQGYQVPVGTTAVATTQQFGTVSFEGMKKTTARYALIVPLEYWCHGCVQEATSLTEIAKQAAPLGGVVFGIMTAGYTPAVAATKENLDDFVQATQASYTFVLDATAPQTPFKDYFGISLASNQSFTRAYYIFVNLRTMQIVKLVTDFNINYGSAEVWSDFQAILAQP